MSLKKIVAEKVQALRKMIAVLDSPSASPAEKGKVLATLVGDDPSFWAQVARNQFRNPAAKPVEKRETVKSVVVPQTSSAPAPKPVPATQPASAPATAPARKLDKSPEERRNGWFKILSAFVAGKTGIDPKKTCALTTSVFRSGVELAREHWEVFFAAMTKAAENGFYILNRDASPPKVFAVAPTDLLSDYIFGQDGALVLTLAEFRELNGNIHGSLIAKTYTLVHAIDALDRNLEDGLGEQELARVDALLAAVEAAEGPEKLIEAIRMIAYGETDEDIPIPPATATIGEIIKIKAANGNGSKPNPEEDARHKAMKGVAEAAAVAFAQAINK